MTVENKLMDEKKKRIINCKEEKRVLR